MRPQRDDPRVGGLRVGWPAVVGVVAGVVMAGLPVDPPASGAEGVAGRRCTIVGTPGADVLTGTRRDDVICGRGGNDRLLGRGGDDRLLGGPGRDVVLGGAGDDRLRGGTGADRLAGGAGDDGVRGGPQGDAVQGGPGADLLRGGPGNDVLYGRDEDRFVDDLSCGDGARDRARADPTDRVRADCELPAPSRSVRCASGTGVAISVGDVAQRVVAAHPAGTTYVIEAGIHLRNFGVQPKSGDAFCGEPGAVLDGGRSLTTAFSGGARGVILDSITVRDYASGWQGAAIQPDPHAGGWVVRNVSALHNGWAGLLASDGMRILGGHYNDNDQLGIGGNATTGIVLDGLDGDPATFDGPELARNHTLHANCDYEAGGMKWDVGTVTVRNAHVHHNDCRGLWADINAHDALIEHNLIEDNFGEGIFYEISRNAVIRNNRVHGNGLRRSGWYWDGGITVASSSNVEIYGNHLSGNYNGITGTQQDRPDSTPPAHLLDGIHVHHNLICATGGGQRPTGVAAGNGADLAQRDITFSDNTVQSAPCR